MSLVVILKFVHVLAAIVGLGANVTYAWWLRRAGLDRERLLYTIGTIRGLDNRIATPAYVVVLVTGVSMVLLGHYSFETGWIAASIALYVLIVVLGIAFFAPAIKRQLSEAERDPSSPEYASAASRSNLFGALTIGTVVVIVFLMVTKPF